MTKRNMLLGVSSGKLGDMVFYRAGGEQRTRTRVTPKNPKTIAQMTNRLLMLNPSVIYKSIKAVVDGGFLTRKSNQTAFNAFMSANKKALPYYITKEMASDAFCAPFGTQLSAGSLGLKLQPSQVEIRDKANSGTPPRYMNVADCLFNTSGYEWPNNTGELQSLYYELPVSEYYNVLKPLLKVSVPDEFVITVVHGVIDEIELDSAVDAWKLSYASFVCKPSGVTMTTGGCEDSQIKKPISLVIQNGADAGEKAEVQHIGIGIANLTALDCAKDCWGIILSYKDANGLQVSNSFMSSDRNFGLDPVKNFMRKYKAGGEVYNQVMSEYGFTNGSMLAGESLPTEESEYEEEEGEVEPDEEP